MKRLSSPERGRNAEGNGDRPKAIRRRRDTALQQRPGLRRALWECRRSVSDINAQSRAPPPLRGVTGESMGPHDRRAAVQHVGISRVCRSGVQVERNRVFDRNKGALRPKHLRQERLHVTNRLPSGFRVVPDGDRKSTRLNSSHLVISYAVFCLKKKKKF